MVQNRAVGVCVCVCIADIFYFGTAALNAVTSLRFCQTKKKKKFACFMCFVFEMDFDDALAPVRSVLLIATSTKLETHKFVL